MTDPMNRVIEDVERELLLIENHIESLNKESASGSIRIVEEEVTKKLDVIGERIPKLESQRPRRESLKNEYGRHFEAYKMIINVHLSDVSKSVEELKRCSNYLQKHLENQKQIQECLKTNQMKLEYAASLLESHPETLLDAKRRLDQLNNRLAGRISSTTELSERISKLSSYASSYKTKLQSLVEEPNR
jgi:chromosome segregation ATPase